METKAVAIDLGLSVKWASCNVGATSPEEYGEYYDWDSAQKLGVQLPTKEQFEELIDNCTWKWTTFNGVNGYKVTGPNGNSIFLPAAGCRYGTEVYYSGSFGYYWSSSLNDYFCNDAYYLLFRSDDHRRNVSNRGYGHTVRPVSE